jgi:hypothetical protein
MIDLTNKITNKNSKKITNLLIIKIQKDILIEMVMYPIEINLVNNVNLYLIKNILIIIIYLFKKIFNK